MELALLAYQWFIGGNDTGHELYDHRTGGCRDGLHPSGPSENQGAESTLSWLQALIQIRSLEASGYFGWIKDRAPAQAISIPTLLR